MSDDTLLGTDPVRFPLPAGGEWLFAPCDLECELRYQTIHTAWARGQVEAMRSHVSPEAHAADLDRHVEHVEGNRFAFGGTLSLRFLCSDHGATEYLAMLAAKAGCRAATRQAIDALRRTDQKAFDDLARTVLGRDFPNLFPPAAASASPAPATPSPSTTEFSSCSVPTRSERAELKSSA